MVRRVERMEWNFRGERCGFGGYQVQALVFLLFVFLTGCGSYPEILRSNINKHAVGSTMHNQFVDARSDHYMVYTKTKYAQGLMGIGSDSLKPSDIPRDALEFAFVNFGKIDKDYKYLNRMVSACRSALGARGVAMVDYIHTHAVSMSMMIDDTGHLKVSVYREESGGQYMSKLYAIDMTKYKNL